MTGCDYLLPAGVRVHVEPGTPGAAQLAEQLDSFSETAPDAPARVTVGPPDGTRCPLRAEQGVRFGGEAVQLPVGCVRRVGDRWQVRGDGELLTALLPVLDLVAVDYGVALVHAATLDVRGAGVCLGAGGGAGKTSTAVWMTRHARARFLGDDWAWVTGSGTLHGWPKPLFLKPHHRGLVPEAFRGPRVPLAPAVLNEPLSRVATAVHPAVTRHPRLAATTRRWSPEHRMTAANAVVGAESVGRRAPLGVVLLLDRHDGTRPQLRRTDPVSAAVRLVGNFHTELPRTSRDLLAHLASAGVIDLGAHLAAKRDLLAASMEGVATAQLLVPEGWSPTRLGPVVATIVEGLLES